MSELADRAKRLKNPYSRPLYWMTLLTAAIYLLAFLPTTIGLFRHIDLPITFLLFLTFLAWTIQEHRIGIIHLPPLPGGKTRRAYRDQEPVLYFTWLSIYLVFGGCVVGIILMLLRVQYG